MPRPGRSAPRHDPALSQAFYRFGRDRRVTGVIRFEVLSIFKFLPTGLITRAMNMRSMG